MAAERGAEGAIMGEEVNRIIVELIQTRHGGILAILQKHN
jgi:hypothetical protein